MFVPSKTKLFLFAKCNIPRLLLWGERRVSMESLRSRSFARGSVDVGWSSFHGSAETRVGQFFLSSLENRIHQKGILMNIISINHLCLRMWGGGGRHFYPNHPDYCNFLYEGM